MFFVLFKCNITVPYMIFKKISKLCQTKVLIFYFQKKNFFYLFYLILAMFILS